MKTIDVLVVRKDKKVIAFSAIADIYTDVELYIPTKGLSAETIQGLEQNYFTIRGDDLYNFEEARYLCGEYDEISIDIENVEINVVNYCRSYEKRKRKAQRIL